jgi:hypothetical protein
MIDARTICDLAAGEFSEWGGLRAFALEAVPACLDSTGDSGWLQFGQRHLAYYVFRLGSVGSLVWLFTFDDGQVRLVEVHELPQNISVDEVLEGLGPTDAQLGYSSAAQMQRPLGEPDERVSEYVFSRRGLALLVGHKPNGSRRILRVRGFEVMPLQRYKELFVDLPEPRFFSE